MSATTPYFALDRSLIPSAIAYLAKHGLLKGGTPKAEFAFVECPAHTPRTRTLRVWLVNGSYRCTTCHARGKDIIDLHRLITGASFVEAVLQLCERVDHG